MARNNHFATRDALIRDRLWKMKAAATDILNLINLELPDGSLDCDGTCDGCVLEELGLLNNDTEQSAVGCTDIVKISEMVIPEAAHD